MKKSITLLSILFLLSLTSCLNESVSDGELATTLKEQKWVAEDISFKADGWYYSETRVTLYFMDDGTGYYSEFNITQYEPDKNNYSRYFTQFTYTVSGDVISTYSTDGNSYSYTYSAGVLESGGWYYIPENITQGDYDLIEEQIEKHTPESGYCGIGVKYSYDKVNKILRIYGNGEMYDYSTSDHPWHDYDIRELVIEEGVTYIGDNFLYGLTYSISLDELEFPNSLERIGDYAFASVNVEKLRIPASVTKIGAGAFTDNYSLLSVYFARNNNLISIGGFAFCTEGTGHTPRIYNGYSEGLVVGAKMRSIGECAFKGCNLGYIKFEEGIKDIAGCAFMGAEISNTKLELPSSLETIGTLAFQGNYSTVKLGAAIEEIGAHAFVTNQRWGSLYMNATIPPKVGSNIISTGDDSNWTLYVPSGCKNLYSKYPWNNFRYIYEDSSLGW